MIRIKDDLLIIGAGSVGLVRSRRGLANGGRPFVLLEGIRWRATV